MAALGDPVWKIKTRPCPFYSQGRCLFAESCSFQHGSTLRAHDITHSKHVAELESEHIALLASPEVHSPSFSPRRSPRLSGLLLALKGVIDDDVSDEDIDDEETGVITTLHHALPSTVHDTSAPQVHALEDAWGSALNETAASMAAARLLSPVDMSDISLIHFERREDSIDSGYEGSWHGPHPLGRSPPDDGHHLSLSSTFDLISSPFGLPRLLSPRLSAFVTRGPVPQYDAQQEEDLLSDLESPKNSEDAVDIADPSPADSGKTEVFIHPDDEDIPSEEYFEPWESHRGDPTSVYVGTSASSSPPTPMFPPPSQVQTNDAIPGEDDHRTEKNQSIECLDETQIELHYEIEDEVFDNPDGHSTFIEGGALSESPEFGYDDEEDDDNEDDAVDSAFGDSPFDEYINRSARSPLMDEVEFTKASPTAQLAYLAENDTTTSFPRENDTLTSFYETYSALGSPDSVDRTPVKSTVVPSPSSSIHRGRVFTPPVPSRERSGTITARSSDSPDSAPSPHLVLSPPPTPPDEAQDVLVSTKVPFGFRHSFTLGRAGTASLAAHRLSRNGATPALQLDPESPVLSASPPHMSPVASPTSSNSRLKPFRLSTLLSQSSSPLSSNSASSSINDHSIGSHRLSMSSVTSSNFSVTGLPLLSSPKLCQDNLLTRTHEQPSMDRPSTSASNYTLHSPRTVSFNSPHSAPLVHPPSWRMSGPPRSVARGWGNDNTANLLTNSDSATDQQTHHQADGQGQAVNLDEDDEEDRTFVRFPHTAPATSIPAPIPPSRPQSFSHAIATPRPTLLFAIASDDVAEVRKVLQSGDAGPNDFVGPQSALAFALTNDQLTHKMEIVKTLLAFGADPGSLKNPEQNPPHQRSLSRAGSASGSPVMATNDMLEGMDPATSYYVSRADATLTRRTSALIHRSFFRPLTRVRYEIIGQDRALEQLFKALSFHSSQVAVAPIVVLLCGGSGHGKSLVARKFGSLLDVPTHTVNLTTITSPHDIWKSFSMGLYDDPTSCSLAEFLMNNEGKRCVVVLDEIEKTDTVNLRSLLMPWEGRAALEAGSRHIDVRNVIWLGTSNIGSADISEYQQARAHPEDMMSREEYMELTRLLRPKVAEQLGAPILSRVTTVLPFCPFTERERRAIAAEALFTLGAGLESVKNISPAKVDMIVEEALSGYSPEEGARSLYRAVSSQLVDI